MAGLPVVLLLVIGLGPQLLLGPGAGLKDWRSLPIGQSDDGVVVDMPVVDRFRARVEQAASAAAETEPEPEPAATPDGRNNKVAAGQPAQTQAQAQAQALTPLEVRHGCAWGQPGRNPYRGTTEQALTAAGLPPEVVQRVALMRTAGEVTDRLQISRHEIRTVAGTREFNPQSFVMTFGNTLCRSSRVNFALGHVEGADLYEVRDNKGRHHAVMVPDVCGNVSVLGNRAERSPGSKLAQALAERGLSSGWLDAVLEDGVLTTAPGGQGGGGLFTVPEPGSLACVLAALGLLCWHRRRRLKAKR